MDDDGVMLTNDEATISKYFASSTGYFKDPFVQHFITSKSRIQTVRKLPEINRGYFARIASISYLVETFILNHTDTECQVISLGAGFDTLFWRLKSNEKFSNCTFDYVELDLPTVTARKVMLAKRLPQLNVHLKDVSLSRDELHSDEYHIVSADLRCTKNDLLERKLMIDCRLKSDIPTLCLFECVLVYMSIVDSHKIIAWLTQHFTDLTIINYEQCNMRDRFGDIMLENMTKRHCELLGVDACDSLDTQKERFVNNGLSHTQAWTLSEIYKCRLNRYDIERIEKIELLDEKELLDQLLNHYCIVIGSTKAENLIEDTTTWTTETIR